MTVVRVTNPIGKQLAENDYSRTSGKFSGSNTTENGLMLQQPNKKFSMLSDIIEQNHSGSSNFGGDEVTIGQNPYPQKMDEI